MNFIKTALLFSALFFLSATIFAESMSNTGTPPTGAYTPGGKAPQAGTGGSVPAAGSTDQNKGSGDWYYDDKAAQWKQKGQ